MGDLKKDKDKFIRLANTNFNKEDVFLRVTCKKLLKRRRLICLNS